MVGLGLRGAFLHDQPALFRRICGRDARASKPFWPIISPNLPRRSTGVDYGARLDAEEQRRRYVIQMLLQAEGLDWDAYRAAVRQLTLWTTCRSWRNWKRTGWPNSTGDRLRLTEAGMERSDTLGPWLYSTTAQRLDGGIRAAMNLSILYRGPLSSCNYGCDYCPFAKHTETDEEHAADARALERFFQWVESRRDDQLSVLFTPWGEALVRKALPAGVDPADEPAAGGKSRHSDQSFLPIGLDRQPATNENWACGRRSIRRRPTEPLFVAKCLDADRRGVRFSVGAVGMKEHAAEIAALRRDLPPHIYVWVNAYKRVPDYYTPDELRHYTAIDPLFPLNNQRHPSFGRACRAGHSVISVDGDGTMRRCHFIREPLGSLYAPDFAEALRQRPCTNETCGCHIGYVHLPHLKLYEVFGDGVLERVPVQKPRRPFWGAREEKAEAVPGSFLICSFPAPQNWGEGLPMSRRWAGSRARCQIRRSRRRPAGRSACGAGRG